MFSWAGSGNKREEVKVRWCEHNGISIVQLLLDINAPPVIIYDPVLFFGRE